MSWTNKSSFEYEDYDDSIWDVTSAADYVAITLGTLTNLWLLLALLTSVNLCSRMRNKFICSLCFVHLLNSLVAFPIQRKIFDLTLANPFIPCDGLSAVHHVDLMKDFISNWTLVLMVTAFLTKTCSSELCGGFKFKSVGIGAYAVLAFPWLVSFVTVPVITHHLHFNKHGALNISLIYDCMFTSDEAYRVIKSLDTFVPLVAVVAMMVAAVVIRRRNFARGLSSGSQVDRLDGGPEVDNLSGYAAALVLTFTIDILDVVANLYVLKIFSVYAPTITVTVYFLTQSKVYFSVLPWLLFPDIRKRIKTWRPWRCPGSDSDTKILLTNVTT